VPQRIQYKLSVLMYRCLNGAAPRYLTELATPVGGTARRRLRSASSTDLVLPATRRSTIGDRAFAAAGPTAWNSPPPAVRSSVSVSQTDRIAISISRVSVLTRYKNRSILVTANTISP